jgi:hypothetical protein
MKNKTNKTFRNCTQLTRAYVSNHVKFTIDLRTIFFCKQINLCLQLQKHMDNKYGEHSTVGPTSINNNWKTGSDYRLFKSRRWKFTTVFAILMWCCKLLHKISSRYEI